MSVSASALFLAAMIMLQSLAFLIAGINTSADNLFDVFITLALYPQNVYGSAVRLLLFTVIPVAYIGLLPVEIMRHFSWSMLGGVIAAAAFYLWLAILIFNRGLRFYTSGNILQR
jgi:ABC-2 type transport system permease protein